VNDKPNWPRSTALASDIDGAWLTGTNMAKYATVVGDVLMYRGMIGESYHSVLQSASSTRIAQGID
jgi:hypothetical protein